MFALGGGRAGVQAVYRFILQCVRCVCNCVNTILFMTSSLFEIINFEKGKASLISLMRARLKLAINYSLKNFSLQTMPSTLKVSITLRCITLGASTVGPMARGLQKEPEIELRGIQGMDRL